MRAARLVGLVIVVLLVTSTAHADCGLFAVGAGYGAPERLSAVVESGCVLSKYRMLVLGGLAGTGGGELSAGAGRLAGIGVVNLRVAVAHTWGSPGQFQPGVTAAGLRLEYSLLGGGLSVNGGLMVPVAGPEPKATRVVWGVAIGVPFRLLQAIASAT